MVRLVVTGHQGQVVQSLIERAGLGGATDLICVGRPDLELSNPDSVRTAIISARPDIVVSAAAYTAVDQAEDEPDMAFAVNATGAGLVSAAAWEAGAPVIHLSTDYVFSGEKSDEYVEADMPDPKNVYGKSKLEGELAVAAANPRHVILRTAWVYSPFGRNFVKTMLGLAAQRDTIRVVGDQWGKPTSALDIADAILKIAAALPTQGDSDRYGLFHLAGQGSTNWSGFARHVLAESRRHGGPFAEIEDIKTSDYPTRALRPKNSRLHCEKLRHIYSLALPDWQNSCSDVVSRLTAST